jgi:hypothetical protein
MRTALRLVALTVLISACSGGADELPDAPALPDAPVDAPTVDAEPGVDAGPDAVVDVTPPETTITSAPPAVDNSTSADLQFEADEPATFECSLDGAAATSCTSPFTATPLADGPHTFSVTATDLADNADPTPATHAWTVDSSTPDTTIITGPGGTSGNAVSSTTAVFTFSSPDAGPGATFQCSLDGAGFTACSSPRTYNSLTEGGHTFAVRVRDAAGNPDPTPAMWSWTVDVSDPNTMIVTGPPSLTNQDGAAFTFTSNEAPVTFECRLDAAAFSPCATPIAYAGLADGDHTFRVRAIDAAGNLDMSPATFTWTIDTQRPNTNITTAPPDPTGSTTATFMFTSNEPGTFTCQLDGGATAACNSGTEMYVGLAGGGHTFAVFATDLAGNSDLSPDTHAWTIDATPPSVTNVTSTTANGTYGVGAAINVRVTFSEVVTVTGSPTLTLETGSVNRIATFASGTGSATLVFNYTVQAGDVSPDLDYVGPGSLGLGGGTIRDAVANNAVLTLPAPGAAGSLGANKAIVIDGVPPLVTITSPADGSTIGPRVTFAWTVDDGSAATCRIDTGASQPCTSPFSTNLPDGPHTFSVTATDGTGNIGSDAASFTVQCVAQTGGPGGIALFHMEETSGQIVENSILTTLDAVLGNNTSAEAIDPTRIAGGRFGRALLFIEDSRDKVSWPTGFAGGPPPISVHDHTIEEWAQIGQAPLSGAGYIYVSGDFRSRLWYDDDGTGKVRFHFTLTNSAGLDHTITAAPVEYDVFHHVVATYAGTSMRLYVDGVAVGGPAVTISDTFNLGTTTFGSTNNNIDGILDEIFISNVGLSSTQVLDRYCPL